MTHIHPTTLPDSLFPPTPASGEMAWGEAPESRRDRWTRDSLFRRLANERQLTSLMEKDLIAGFDPFVRDTDNWVRMWVDPDNSRISDCGTATAYRGITDDGELVWLVRADKKRHGYHSRATDPFEAMDEALSAWAARSRIRKTCWAEIEATARDLRRGRLKFDVTLEDAHRSPLCDLGIRAFMRWVGIGRVTRISGRMAGCLMLIEPQMGFVIHEATRRVADRS